MAIYYVNSIRIGQAVKRGNMAKVKDILQHEKKLDNMEFNLRQIRNRYLRKYYESIGDYRGAYEILGRMPKWMILWHITDLICVPLKS